MKIVVLDGYCLNPGDLSWEALSRFGEYTVYDRTPPGLIAERAKDADIIAVNKIVFDEKLIASLPRLKLVCVLATGYNIIDTAAARRYGVTVTNIPAYSTEAVAQLVFAFILGFANKVSAHNASVHAGEWASCPDFCYTVAPIYELKDKTIGIIGYGSIGKQVAKIAKAFNMNVIATSRSHTEGTDGVAEFSDMDSVVKNADFLTLHTPLTEETKELVNREFLAKMKKTAYLINTSRGPVVNESDLAEALKNGVIAGAAADVLSSEPAKADCPLVGTDNCVITPHIAWAPYETRQRLMDIFIGNIGAFLENKPVNVVN